MLGMTTEDKTYVVVTGTGFANEYAKRDHYFLNKEQYKPLHVYRDVDIYAKTHGEEKGHVFFKGVRVMQTQHAALFDYNHHLGLLLTEDRTISNTWSTLYHVAPLVTQSTDKAFIKKMVMAIDVYESNLDFCVGQRQDLMDCFLDVVGKLRDKYKDRGINRSAIKLHKEMRGKTDVMPGISCHLNPVQTQQLENAKNFCRDILELDLDSYKLIVCKDIADDLGQANIEEGIMYISKKCFDQGTKRVAVALLENSRGLMKKALDKSNRFYSPSPISHKADSAAEFLSIGNQTGEGWFLTGEMAELIKEAIYQLHDDAVRPEDYSGHSLRRRFLTSAGQEKADLLKLIAQSRHTRADTAIPGCRAVLV